MQLSAISIKNLSVFSFVLNRLKNIKNIYVSNVHNEIIIFDIYLYHHEYTNIYINCISFVSGTLFHSLSQASKLFSL